MAGNNEGRVGRTDPEAILADALAVMDLEVRRMKMITARGVDLGGGEARALSDYVRVLNQAVVTQRRFGSEDLEKLTDEELDQIAEAIAKKRLKK